MITLSLSKPYFSSLLAAALAFLLAVFSIEGQAAYQFVSSFGTSGSSGGQFSAPRGVAISQLGKIVITESGNHRVQVCTDQGICTNFGDFGTLSGEFDRPRGLAVSSVDRVFIADRGNDRIESCAITGSCTDFGGSGTVVGKFESPRGVAIDPQDMIYITDTDNNRVQVCDVQGNCTAFGSFGPALGQFDSPAGIAIDSQGKVVIADRGNDRIQICSAQGTNCTAFGSFGTAVGQFDQPAGIAVDSQDRIIVVDRFNDRVQVCSQQGACTTFGSFGSAQGQFDIPWGVAVDGQDRIIVADTGNDRIQIFADTAAAAVQITVFTASPVTIEEGQSTTLSWSVSNATSCSALNGTSDWQAITPAAAGGTTDITIASAGSYSFTLQCTDGINTVSANAGVTVTIKPNTPPTQPGMLSASAVTGSSATVSWAASTDVDGDTITYQVEYRRNGDLAWTPAGSTTASSQALSSLDADQLYDVRITPNDGSVDGPDRTMPSLFKTDFINTPPTQPGILSASAISSNSAMVSWGASTDIDADTITYQVNYRRNGDRQWSSGGSTTGTSQPLNGLDADQSYDVWIIPNDGTADGSSRTKLNLFKTDIDPGAVFKNSFEGN